MRSALSVGALAMLETALPNVFASSVSALPVASEKKRYFAPVKVERSRLIRTVVGLRPFRRAGFVVEAGRLGEKFLVHNYGHGGAGVTLSWGTSSAAVDLTREFNLPGTARSFAVLGCGVIGLTTARSDPAPSDGRQLSNDLCQKLASRDYFQHSRRFLVASLGL